MNKYNFPNSPEKEISPKNKLIKVKSENAKKEPESSDIVLKFNFLAFFLFFDLQKKGDLKFCSKRRRVRAG